MTSGHWDMEAFLKRDTLVSKNEDELFLELHWIFWDTMWSNCKFRGVGLKCFSLWEVFSWTTVLDIYPKVSELRSFARSFFNYLVHSNKVGSPKLCKHFNDKFPKKPIIKDNYHATYRVSLSSFFANIRKYNSNRLLKFNNYDSIAPCRNGKLIWSKNIQPGAKVVNIKAIAIQKRCSLDISGNLVWNAQNYNCC